MERLAIVWAISILIQWIQMECLAIVWAISILIQLSGSRWSAWL